MIYYQFMINNIQLLLNLIMNLHLKLIKISLNNVKISNYEGIMGFANEGF